MKKNMFFFETVFEFVFWWADPKKSLSASSWLTDANLADLACKSHAGRGGPSIVIGVGWIFEPHTMPWSKF